MKIRRDQHIGDITGSIDDYGFDFQHYLRDGTEKYVDAVGNAILINREGIVVTIYSHDADSGVNELLLPESAYRPRWPEYDANEVAEEERTAAYRREQLRPAWNRLRDSLPPPDDVSDELRRAIRNLREDLKYVSDDIDSLAELHDAVENIQSLCPAADISALLLQIAKSATKS